ncbi:vacuolar-sorting SNF8 [Cordyceps militaris]|uniref:Vacuolar-sorting protein SNF8 n=1 Tax=Cordyceps militaris TaxID=73501 RepID=A0A2H4S5Y7_CORMI|nr:vacuolar-sorting SNF8 [Cordyceps militaris]
MSRKAVGIGALDRSRLTSAQYASHGSSLRATNAQALETQLAVFRTLLQQFAQTHARDIRSDPSFRAQFARMCSAIGVDPLASSAGTAAASPSVWGQLLGKTVNDFYFDVAVRVVQVCGATRAENGGLVSLAQVRERVSRDKVAAGGAHVSEDDVRRAVATLRPLGGSYAIVTVGETEYVRSVPRELSRDQASCVEAAQVLGHVSVGMLRDNLAWEPARCKTVIDDLVAQGMLWVDKQTGGEWQYWSPAFMAGIGGTDGEPPTADT